MSDKVTIYSDAEYHGKSADMAVGRCDQIPFGNDSLSSLKVPSGLKVTLTARSGNGGRLFGSITPAEIVDAVKHAGGPSLDRRRLEPPRVAAVRPVELQRVRDVV